MRVAWVEDDGGQFKDGVKAFVRLLDEISLSGEDDLLNRFDDLNSSDDLSSENISNFFDENTLHNLEWFDRYSGMQSSITGQSKYRWDVVILDLNLEHGFEKEVFSVVPDTAGFALYVQLLRAGFPPENIVFSTNNAKQTEVLEDVCDRYDIPKARYLDKLKQEQLQEWLRSHLENERLMLRRGIIDGCAYMKELLEKDPDQRIRINDCVDEKIHNQDDDLVAESVLDWLEAWPQLLPEITLANKDNSYAVFLLALLAMWDGKKGLGYSNSPKAGDNAMFQALKNLRPSVQSRDEDDGFFVIPYILRWARNWIVHNKALHDASIHASAYLFLLAGRGLICNAHEPLRHEKILLLLINGEFAKANSPNTNTKRNLDDICKSLKEAAKDVLRIKNTDLSVYRLNTYRGNSPFFNRAANDYVHNGQKLDFHYRPEQLLMLSLLIDLPSKDVRMGSFLNELRSALTSRLFSAESKLNQGHGRQISQ